MLASIDNAYNVFEIGKDSFKEGNPFNEYQPKVSAIKKGSYNISEFEKDYHINSNSKFKMASEGKNEFSLYEPKNTASFKMAPEEKDPFLFLTNGKHFEIPKHQLAPYYEYKVAGKSYFDLSLEQLDEQNGFKNNLSRAKENFMKSVYAGLSAPDGYTALNSKVPALKVPLLTSQGSTSGSVASVKSSKSGYKPPSIKIEPIMTDDSAVNVTNESEKESHQSKQILDTFPKNVTRRRKDNRKFNDLLQETQSEFNTKMTSKTPRTPRKSEPRTPGSQQSTDTDYDKILSLRSLPKKRLTLQDSNELKKFSQPALSGAKENNEKSSEGKETSLTEIISQMKNIAGDIQKEFETHRIKKEAKQKGDAHYAASPMNKKVMELYQNSIKTWLSNKTTREQFNSMLHGADKFNFIKNMRPKLKEIFNAIKRQSLENKEEKFTKQIVKEKLDEMLQSVEDKSKSTVQKGIQKFNKRPGRPPDTPQQREIKAQMKREASKLTQQQKMISNAIKKGLTIKSNRKSSIESATTDVADDTPVRPDSKTQRISLAERQANAGLKLAELRKTEAAGGGGGRPSSKAASKKEKVLREDSKGNLI